MGEPASSEDSLDSLLQHRDQTESGWPRSCVAVAITGPALPARPSAVVSFPLSSPTVGCKSAELMRLSAVR
ncbi:Uncharacterised protein [Mycobacteroides abscessus subsp. abscessus]|nr:Uncharacterised protein [Mycobacteroides abscessus subsp. abscessus]